MPMILSYQKITDEFTTHCLREPDYDDDQRVTELCTTDDTTYISVPDNIALPEQPELIRNSLTILKTAKTSLDEKTRAIIESLSPHIRLINQRVVERIRKKYTINDEIKLLRLAPPPETAAWNDYVENCRAWGAAEKEKLGLAT